MMATEVAPENLADATSRADDEPNTTSSLSDDASTEKPPVNGEPATLESKQIVDHEHTDGAVTSAEVSVSGGSDSETTKAETTKALTDDKGHLRTASGIKKPTSFKAVSVNKKFLATKVSSPQPPKAQVVGPTPTSTLPTSSTPRPRLVAKTGSSLRDASPRLSGSATGGKPGTPDPNVVWNKNRPAPPPEPKKFTDEELKQQYGIHLATRLQADDPGKQGNWADIDDDDDDWAPETIEWTDGTKATLHAAEEAAAIPPEREPESAPAPAPEPEPEPEPIPVAAKETKSVEPPKSSSPAPAATPSTKLKLGGTGAGRGLVLKGAPEKPTLVAKPAAPPAPVKSPWAPLPPVNKVPPIPIEPNYPPQPAQSRFHQRDPHGFDGMPPLPTKEIAADDFSRTWRDGQQHSRELYNSQSGRYEPVHDGRRGSRGGPALLQRGPHDQMGPAEPSAAFQTHRTSGQESSWGRRRTSSNVSGGSGAFGRRASRGAIDMPPPSHDSLNARRGSMTGVSDSPTSPAAPPYRGLSNHPPWQQRASPALSHASPASVHSQLAPRSDTASAGPGLPPPQPAPQAADLEAELELQKKIMRERREEARRRRLEEEAKEEAAKKERIRLKLEALGPPPEPSSQRKETTTSKQEQEKAEAPTSEVSPQSTAPPKPPVPENAGETKQYGMMKVHHPDSAQVQAAEVKSTEAKSPEAKSALTDAAANGTHPTSPKDQAKTTGSAPIDQRAKQPWQQAAPSADRFSGWGMPSAAHGGNVWGPPSNDRSLGNGTFNPELSRIPEIRGAPPSRGPGAIGPPGPHGPPHANGQYHPRNREPYAARPPPIGPPQRQDGRPSMAQNWQNKILQQDVEMRKQAEEANAKLLEMRASGELQGPTYKETFREVKVDEQGYRVESHRTEHFTDKPSQPNNWDGLANRPNQDSSRSGDGDVPHQRGFQDAWRTMQAENHRSDAMKPSTGPSGINSSPPVRQSKWFPVRDVRLEEPAFVQSITRPSSPSPPPPTMAGHPAYDGDITHPHVSLPRPSPIVRLPPTAALAPIAPPRGSSHPAQNPVLPSNVITPAMPRQDLRNRGVGMEPRPVQSQTTGGGWQDKINHLMGKKSPSHSAASLVPPQPSVSLPKVAPTVVVSEGDITSRSMAEECFEEQEMGSLPVVRVPFTVPEAGWHLAPQPKPIPRKFVISHPATYDSVTFEHRILNSGHTVSILFPGMADAKTIELPHKERPPKNNSRRGSSQPRATRHPSSSHTRGNRASSSEQGHLSPTHSGRGGHRGRGGFSNSPWSNRHPTTPAAAV